MSKISLAPDASGTGIFTIASPNSNTNRTLTLPDDTGTIVTNSGNQAGSFTTLNTSGAVVFNDAGANVDFRVESDTVDHALFVEGSSGNVGIGTSSPLTNLHVRVNALSGYTSVANSGLLIERGNGPAALNIASPNTESGFIWFADQDSASVGNIAYNHASNFMSFQTNGSERARIDSSGNVGIGTDSPASDARLTLDNGGSGSVALMFRRSGSGEVDCAIQNDAALVFRAGTDSSTVAGITERARITSDGDLLVGSSSTQGTSNKSINFGGGLGGCASVDNNSLANNGTLDITFNNGGGGWMGILMVSNSNPSNAGIATRTIFAVLGRGTSATFTSLATQNGPTGGYSFSMSCPSNGVMRVTNTSGATAATVMTLYSGIGG